MFQLDDFSRAQIPASILCSCYEHQSATALCFVTSLSKQPKGYIDRKVGKGHCDVRLYHDLASQRSTYQAQEMVILVWCKSHLTLLL